MNALDALSAPSTRPLEVAFAEHTATVRVLKATSEISKSSSKPMIVVELEIVAPETIQCLDGGTYSMQGDKFKHYFPLHVTNRPGGLNSFAAALAATMDGRLQALGLSATDQLTDIDPAKIENKVVECVLAPRSYSPKEKLTDADIDAGRKADDARDEKGNKIVLYGVNVKNFIPASA